MKKFLSIFLITGLLFACKDKGGDVGPKKTFKELISLNGWKLDRFSQPTGEPITNNELNTTAILLYAMKFEFRADGEVRGIDKTSGAIIDKGVWRFIDKETSVNVQLTALNYDFRVISLTTGKMTLQAPTGNFLSGVGEQINLEFSSVTN